MRKVTEPLLRGRITASIHRSPCTEVGGVDWLPPSTATLRGARQVFGEAVTDFKERLRADGGADDAKYTTGFTKGPLRSSALRTHGGKYCRNRSSVRRNNRRSPIRQRWSPVADAHRDPTSTLSMC